MTATLPSPADAVLSAIARSFEGTLGRATSREDALRCAPIAYSAAIHEAGHVVAGVVLHGPEAIDFATIIGDADRELNGFVRFRFPRPDSAPLVLRWQGRRPVYLRNANAEEYWTDRTLRNEGIRSYAGVVAQYRSPFAAELDRPDDDFAVDSEEYFDQVRESSAQDRAGLARAADFLDRVRPPEEWRADYWRAALRLLSQRWEAVHAVAAALLEHGTVAGAELDRIVVGELMEGEAIQ